jgi:nitrate reductase NapA
MGMNQHTRGTAINRWCTASTCSAGTSAPGRRPTSLTGQPSACGTVREVGTLATRCRAAWWWPTPSTAGGRGDLEPPRGPHQPKPGYHTVEMWEALLTPGGPRAATSTPSGCRSPTRRSRCPTSTSSSTPPQASPASSSSSRTCTRRPPRASADLVLPSAMWVEKNGMVGNSERRTQQWFKMVNPPGEARDDAGRPSRWPEALRPRPPGMKDKDGKLPVPHRDAAGAEVPSGSGPLLRRQRRRAAVRGVPRSRASSTRTSRPTPSTRAPAAALARRASSPTASGARPATASSRATTVREEGRGHPVLPLDTKDDRAQIWFHPYETRRPRCPTRSTPSGCAPGACSSTGTPAR